MIAVFDKQGNVQSFHFGEHQAQEPNAFVEGPDRNRQTEGFFLLSKSNSTTLGDLSMRDVL